MGEFEKLESSYRPSTLHPINEMLRAKLLKNRVSGAGHIYRIAVVACLIIGWSRPAQSIETSAVAEEEPHLQVAPIRLLYKTGGALGYTYRSYRSGGAKTTQQTLYETASAGVAIKSFFWQPWFAKVGSTLTGSVLHSSTNSNSTPTQDQTQTAFTGDATLELLNLSRYPFTASIYRNDNRFRASYSGTNRIFQTTGYRLLQDYSNRNRRIKANASFSSSKSGGPELDDSFADQFNFSSNIQATRYNSFALSGSVTKQSIPSRDQSFLTDSLMGHHVYAPNTSFSLGTMANFFNFRQSYHITPTLTSQSDVSSQQFSSIASVRPEATPLTVTGSVRLLKKDANYNGIPTPTLKSSNFNLGANYLFSKLIRMYGSVNVTDNYDTQEVTSTAALTAAKPFSFKSATILDEYRYSGSAGGSISTSNQTRTDSANQTTSSNSLGLGLYLTHALDKDSTYYAGRLSKNLNQTVSTSFTGNGKASSVRLSSGGSLTWTRGEGKASTMLRLNARDVRNLSGAQYSFQMINLQASRSEAISSHESLTGSLTVQATRQANGILGSPITISPNAQMTYRHDRIFRVRQLKFESILRLADTNIAPGAQNKDTRTWENNLSYRIARLDIGLDTRILKSGNAIATTIFFHASRAF